MEIILLALMLQLLSLWEIEIVTLPIFANCPLKKKQSYRERILSSSSTNDSEELERSPAYDPVVPRKTSTDLSPSRNGSVHEIARHDSPTPTKFARECLELHK